MTLHFTVNVAFWQLLKQYQPKLAKTINPELKRLEQTFPGRMFDNTKGPLQMPSTLPDIVKRLNEDGRKFRPSEINSPPICSKFKSNIITVVAGGLACICTIVILVIMVKQFRLQSLVSSLGLVSLIPLTKAYYLAESFVVLSMLLIKCFNHYHGTLDIKTVDAALCTFSCIMMITMHLYE